MKPLPFSLALILIAAQAAAAGDVTTQPTLTLEGAKRVVAAAMAYARSHDAPGAAVAVVDAGGHTILLERLDGSFPASADVSIGKARTASRFRRESRTFYNAFETGHAYVSTLEAGIVASPGGFPLVDGGKVIGAIGCSGGTGDQDAAICKVGADVVK